MSVFKYLKRKIFGETVPLPKWFKIDPEIEAFIKKESMPSELMLAKLTYCESRVVANDNSIYGDIDQGFMDQEGRIILVDTKVRNNKDTKWSDLIQLSSYAYILKQKGINVAHYGYLRIVNRFTGKVGYKKVDLLPDNRLRLLIDEYNHIDSMVV